METTNVNSRRKGGLKRYLEHKIPLLCSVGYNSHKLALCFKHLVSQFPCISEADVFLLYLWQYFKYQPLTMSFLENFADIYSNDPVVPISPSVTHWIAHQRACLTFFKGYRPFLHAVTFCYNEKKEAETLGLFIQETSQQTITTILMLLEVFNCIKAMLLTFQKNQGSICLSNVETSVETTT